MQIIQQDGGRFDVGFPGVEESIRLEKNRNKLTRLNPLYKDMKLDQQQYIELSLRDSVAANTPELISRIKMSDNPEEISDLIGNNTDAIVGYIYKSNVGDEYISLLYNLKAVMVLKDKFAQMKQVNGFTMYYINTLIYHILSSNPDISDNDLGIYRGLLYEVNKDLIQRLQRNNQKDGINKPISVKDCTFIAMCRYSCPTNFLLRGVERTNFAIANFDSGAEVYTQQMLIYIYEELFENITPLFLGTIYKSVEFLDEYDECNQQVLWNQVNAVMSILNFQEYDVITHTLYEFAQKFIYLYDSNPASMIRPFRSLPLDQYPLIFRCINTLHRSGVDMP